MLWLIHTYNVMLPHSAECAAANRLLAERGEWGAEEGGRSWSCCPERARSGAGGVRRGSLTAGPQSSEEEGSDCFYVVGRARNKLAVYPGGDKKPTRWPCGLLRPKRM